MRAHGSFYALCEGAGSSADIMAKTDDHGNSDQKQNEPNENEFLIDLSSNCKSETDDQYEEDELMYVLRRKPKRSRRLVDQDFINEDEASLNKRNVDGDDPEFAGRIMPAERCKKPMFTCKLQDKAPPACTECGKEFNSWKALFGHMRCHPEREWRGIQPPAEYMSSMKAHKDTIARNGTMEGNRYIVVKPLQASKHELLRRKEIVDQFRSSQSVSLSHDVNKANYNQSREDGLADDSIVGCIRGGGKLQWSSCGKQVMLEEEEESDTESIETAYISNNKDGEDRCLRLLASFSRGKRSKRSHVTVKSLRSVQDQLSAKVLDDVQPKDEDLEMANCLVMLALAGSAANVIEGEKQEGLTVSKSDDNDEVGDDEEGTVDEQVRLTWGSNLCSIVEESKTDASSLDGTNAGVEAGKYECAACKRSFKSHQALGGHRASHKKVKGCFAKTAADVEASPTCKDGIAINSTYIDTSILTLAGICKDQMAATSLMLPDRNGDCKDLIATNSTYLGTSAYDVSGGHISVGGGLNMARGTPNSAENGPFQLLLDSMDAGIGSRPSKLALHNTSKFHQCSICQRVFSSGQALGGHKRCHWAADKADRQITAASSEIGTGVSAMAMACVATPPAMAKITFFTRPPPIEEATHQVKVLDIDLNLPAPLDVDAVNSTNANIVNACKHNNTLGSLLSLGQCSSVTIQAPIDVDDDSFHSGGPDMTGHHVAVEPAAYSGTSSPLSTTSVHVSEIGPCL